MDEQDPEMDQIPKPTIQPRANLAQLKACMDTLNDEEHDTLMRMMGETHLQDFLDAWSDQHWSSEGQHQMYTCPVGNQWTYDFSFTRSWKEPKHLPL